MYPLPTQEVLSKLTDSSVWSIGFGAHVVHISFENGNRISISSPFRFGKYNELSGSIQDFPILETSIVRLINTSIIKFNIDKDKTLDFQFSNEDRLIIYSNSPMYESYSFLIDYVEYIV